MMFFDALCNLCTGLNQQPLKKLESPHWPLLVWVRSLYKKTVCSLLRYSSEFWISCYFLRGQLSACTTMCPTDTLLLNGACAIQEQVWDFSWGSLWEGLLSPSCGDRHPRKPNVIGIVWVGVRVVLYLWGGSSLWDWNLFREWC